MKQPRHDHAELPWWTSVDEWASKFQGVCRVEYEADINVTTTALLPSYKPHELTKPTTCITSHVLPILGCG